ncbi:hypothetical protein NLX83_33030 [Allokutzneria sp. A3M-2-11 16]|uniref:hypothetical protein n=1 Tax=Allokutzneria sp. A3M-2-11 16 TaxID=2962043 RepID=UPI0020B753FC|nr:hypothetical protein [Allokutzneria sp. A3M-2-11 16]MCP3804107.1 hypothetical protein [Allokutzneria sp. A3M-2-11 16]
MRIWVLMAVGLTVLAIAVPATPEPSQGTPLLQAEQRIEYGSTGNGNPQTADCTAHVSPGGSINDAIGRASSGAVVCVRAGDYRAQTVNLNKAGVTVRSNGVAPIRNATVSGRGATLEGFTVVGDGSGPNAGISLSGTDIKVVNNLVNGGNLMYGIQCARNACDNNLIAQNTVTGIESIGMYVDEGTGTVVERNNIYDLHNDRGGSYDVDGVRFWGKHVFRYNYIHDINEFASGNRRPHVDCFQTYNGSRSSGTVIENNYCLRVSRQCLIAQNNRARSYEISNIVFRNNVCETYDSQAINLGSMSGVLLENNLVLGGFRYQIVNLEVMRDSGLANTNTTIRNNVLVRAEQRATTYKRAGASTNERFSNNLELLDTSINGRDEAFHGSTGPYPSHRPQDFTAYRSYAQGKDIVDKGIAGNDSRTDVDGNPRVAGAAIDLGPFEIR